MAIFSPRSSFAPRSPGPWRARLFSVPAFLRGTRPVFLAFLASRLVIIGCIILSQTVVLPGSFGRPNGLLRVFLQWDAGWYLDIVRDGYTFDPSRPTTMGFLPFYPMLVKLASFLVPDPGVAGVWVANLCLLAAGCLLQALIKLEYKDPRVSHAAVMFLMFSPVSYFFSSAYTESTFLMLALASFLAARKQQWLIAGLCGMCLSATRQVGLLITLPLLVEYLHQSWSGGVKLRALWHPRILLLGLVPLGFVLFMLYGYLQFNDFFAFFHATAHWGRKLTSPLRTLDTLPTNPPFHQWLFLGLFLVGISVWSVGLFCKLRPSYSVYAALLITTYVCSNSMEAMPRSLSVVFPLFIVLGLLATRFDWTYEPMLCSSIALLTLCTILSAAGFWMT